MNNMGQFAYFPHTDEDIRQMLGRIGAGSLDDLYSDVPADCIFTGEYDIPDAMSEIEVRKHFEALDAMNSRLCIFSGLGAYDHYTPSVIPYITSRSEFLTAYTPYQCEISQGTLRYIFEFQSMICQLTGLDVSNASLYDGPTAAAEAMAMAAACNPKKKRVLLSSTLLPNVLRVVETYAGYHGVEIAYIDCGDGQTSRASLEREMAAGDVAGVIVPGINRYGIVEDLEGFAELVHGQKALFIEYCDPSSLAVLRTPAEWGADIAVGDGQPLGIPLCFGGPYVGFMAVKDSCLRKMPGRIVGQTTDKNGKRAYVLTLQAREQHIRREKATSNICSNQSLMALFVTVYLSLMGPEGMKQVNDLSYAGAHYLHDRLLSTGKFAEVFGKPFLKEFVLKPLVPADKLQEALIAKGFFAAVQTDEGYVNFCVTEKRTKAEMDALVAAIEEAEL